MGVFQDPVSRQWYQGPDEDGSQDQPLLDHGIIKDPMSGQLFRVPASSLDHWRKPAAPVAAQAPNPEQDDGVTFGDYGRSIMSGGAQLVQGLGWATKMLGADDIGGSIEELGRDAVDYWNEGLSDAAKRELSKEFVTKNADGDYEWGDAGLQTIGLYGAQSLLGTAAGAGVGAGVTKVLQIFANPVGRSALIKAAQAGSAQAVKKLKLVDGALGAAGFGAGEGLVAAPQSGINVYESVMKMDAQKLAANPRYQDVFNSTDEKTSWLERHQYAADTVAKEASSVAGFQAGLTSALLGAPMGAFFGKLFGRSALGAMTGNRAGNAAVGGAGEAAQEFAQSGTQQVIENKARQGAGDDVDTLDNVLNQALGGALAGAPIGAALGGSEGAQNLPPAATTDRQPGAAPSPPGAPSADPVQAAADEAIAAGVPPEQAQEIVKAAADGTEPVLVAVGRLKNLKTGITAGADAAAPAITPETGKPVGDPAVTAPAAKPAAQVTATPPAAKPEAKPEAAPAIKVGRDANLKPEDKAIEEELAQRIEREPDKVMAEYAKIEGTQGGKLLNTDLARELSPAYLKDRTKSAAVHEPASSLVKEMYARKLAEQPETGDLPEVIFTAGGTGAGKTTGLTAAAKINPDVDRSQIIYDTNMNGAKSSIQKIEQALIAGKTVKVIYTYRDPVDALVNGALPRAKRQAAKFGTGRTVPLEAHIDTHVGARDTMQELAAKYRDDPRVTVWAVDNSGGKDSARVVDLEKIPQLSYDAVREQAESALEREYEAGRIDQRTYSATRGNLPKRGVAQETGGGQARPDDRLRDRARPAPDRKRASGRDNPAVTAPAEEAEPDLTEELDLAAEPEAPTPEPVEADDDGVVRELPLFSRGSSGYTDPQREERTSQEAPSPRSPTPRRERFARTQAAIRSHRERNAPASRSYASRSREDGGRARVLGVPTVAEFAPSETLRDTLGSIGAAAPSFHELAPAGASLFQDSIAASKQGNPFGAAVYVYSEAEYRDMRLFLTDDGRAGFALKGDDIVSVFALGPHKGAAAGILELAVQEGGRRLDAFDTVLPDLYAANGFKTVARIRWNDEYSPEGWDKNTFDAFSGGEPDVVFMVYDPENAQAPTGDDGVLAESYDDAVAAQRDALKGESKLSRRSSAGSQAVEVVQKELAGFVDDIAPLVDVQIVGTVEELIERTGQAVPGDVEGAWNHGTTVYLVAENIAPGDAARIATHEVFGHLAMERFEEGRKAIDLVKELRTKNKEIGALWQTVGERQPNLTATDHAKEVIALMAERGDKHAVVTRLIAGMKRWLRSLGLKTEWSDTDIRDMIARSARALRREADRARTLRPKLRALTPASTDAQILAALDEDMPPTVVAMDTYLQMRADLDALNERGGEFDGIEERKAELQAAIAAMEGQADDRDGILHTPAQKEAQRQAMLFSRAAPAAPAIQVIMDRVLSKPPEAYTMKDRIRQVVDKVKGQSTLEIKQGLIDSFASIETLEKDFTGGALLDASQSAYKAALATKNLSSVMAAVMLNGVPAYQNGTYAPVAGRKGVIDIFKPLTEHKDGNLLQQWELFAAAARADRLIKEKNPDGTQRENLFTQAEINEALKLGQKYPEFNKVSKDWAEFNKQMLDLAEAAGIVDGTTRPQWERNDYVPFYRAVDVASGQAEGPRNRRGVANQRSDIKRLRGSDKALGNVFENMMMNTAHLLDASFKNRAMQRIVGLGTGTALDPVPLAAQAVKLSDEQLARALSAAGLVVGNAKTDPYGKLIIEKMTPAQKDHWSTLFQRVAPKGPNIVSVMEKGKPQYYEVTDPLVLKSIAGMGHDNFSDVMGLFRGSKRLLTNAITADPAFMMANFVRDTLSNWVISDVSTKPITGALSGLMATFKNDPVLVQMMMAGAGGGGFYDSNPDEIRKLIAEKVPAGQRGGFMSSVVGPKNLWQVWRKIGAATENANRVAVFKAVLSKGGTVAEAAYQARDTLNFSMSGDYGAMRWLTQSVPFLNARVQGLYRLYRGARDNKRAFFIKGTMLMAATLALALRNNDREEYEELPEWDKDTYWHLFIGGEHFRIPKPFEVGAMFATAPERMWRTLSGRDSGRLLFERIAQMFADTFAFNPTPQLIKPIIEQYANRSMFTGSPIVGMAEKNLQPEAQFTPWTSEFMREFASLMPDWAPEWSRSPQRLEAALRGYTGSLGMYVLGVGDAMTRTAFGYPDEPSRKLTDMPVVKRFWADPNPRHTKYSDQLYKWMNEANAANSTINRLLREQRLDEAMALREQYKDKLMARVRLNKIGTNVRNINENIRRIQLNRSMEPGVKRERIDQMVERKNLQLRQIAQFSDMF